MSVDDHEARIRRLERRSAAIRRTLAGFEETLAYPKWALKLPPWSDGDRGLETPPDPDRPVGCVTCDVPETLLFDRQLGGISGTLNYEGAYNIPSSGGGGQCFAGDFVGYLSDPINIGGTNPWARFAVCCRNDGGGGGSLTWTTLQWATEAAAIAMSTTAAGGTNQNLIINSCNPVDWYQASGVNYVFRVYEP